MTRDFNLLVNKDGKIVSKSKSFEGTIHNNGVVSVIFAFGLPFLFTFSGDCNFSLPYMLSYLMGNWKSVT